MKDDESQSDPDVDLFAQATAENIAPPAVPASLQPSVRTLGDWAWGTLDFSPRAHYFLPQHLVWLLTDWDRRPLYLFSHGGHGVNSYSLNVTVAVGDVAVYAQASYGGVYSDRDVEVADADSLFRRIDGVIAAAHPDALARWLVVCSTYRGVYLLVDLTDVRMPAQPFEPPRALEPGDFASSKRDGEVKLFAEARRRLSQG